MPVQFLQAGQEPLRRDVPGREEARAGDLARPSPIRLDGHAVLRQRLGGMLDGERLVSDPDRRALRPGPVPHRAARGETARSRARGVATCIRSPLAASHRRSVSSNQEAAPCSGTRTWFARNQWQERRSSGAESLCVSAADRHVQLRVYIVARVADRWSRDDQGCVPIAVVPQLWPGRHQI
jgi:hypothetical protein